MRTRPLMFAAALGLLVAGCGLVDQVRGPGAVVALAKAEGWRDGMEAHLAPFALVEIAYDRDTAARAWADNVPDGLADRERPPAEPGLYGDLDDVDFDRQVVVVWSSGQSSSCPGWLDDIDVDDTGTVHVELDDTAGPIGACTDDYNPYRMVLAVDRDRVPDPEALPTEDVGGVPPTGALVASYPADVP